MDNTNRCGLIRKHRNKLEKIKKTKKNKTMNLALHAPLPILTPQKVQMRKESKGSGGGRGIKRKTKIVQRKYYSKWGVEGGRSQGDNGGPETSLDEGKCCQSPPAFLIIFTKMSWPPEYFVV